MIVLPLRTKPSGLYRHRRDLVHSRFTEKGRCKIRTPSLPSTQRRVPSGHRGRPSILYLHGPSVRPMSHRLAPRGPHSLGLPHSPPRPRFSRPPVAPSLTFSTHARNFLPLSTDSNATSFTMEIDGDNEQIDIQPPRSIRCH